MKAIFGQHRYGSVHTSNASSIQAKDCSGRRLAPLLACADACLFWLGRNRRCTASHCPAVPGRMNSNFLHNAIVRATITRSATSWSHAAAQCGGWWVHAGWCRKTAHSLPPASGRQQQQHTLALGPDVIITCPTACGPDSDSVTTLLTLRTVPCFENRATISFSVACGCT
jgi:hypothetical protein